MSYFTCRQGELRWALGMREIQMGKTLFAVSTAALMVAFAVGWAIPNTQARVAPAASAQVDTFQIMTSAKQMPPEHFADYSFVF